MTDKAYIVANKQQELEVLNKFEQDGILWIEGQNPTDWLPSKNLYLDFPYVLIYDGVRNIIMREMEELENETIVYDGRKEEKMYRVTQEFMNELIKWRDEMNLNANDKDFNAFVNGNDIQNVPDVVYIWWRRIDNPIERNNRLIAIIQWLNGEEVFEVEAPHKFVVRSKEINSAGYYSYVKVVDQIALNTDYNLAMKFDTREEAQEWANSHQVVIEIDAE